MIENKVQIEIYKKEISDIEKLIEVEFNNICKAERVNYDRNNDWGVKQFGMVVILDEINLTRFDEISGRIKNLAIHRKNLRDMQNKLEKEIDINGIIDRSRII